MTESEKTKALIGETHPSDGFRVRHIQVGKEHSLHLTYQQNGVPVPIPTDAAGRVAVEFFKKYNPTDACYGEMNRLQLLVEALCRYLNTGGFAGDMQEAFNLVFRTTSGVSLSIPGTALMSSHVNTEGVYEHVFIRTDAPYAIRWVEDQFIDVVDYATLREEASERAAEQPWVELGSGSNGGGGSRSSAGVQHSAGYIDPARTLE